MKSSRSELVRARRSTVLSLPLQQGFPASSFDRSLGMNKLKTIIVKKYVTICCVS